MRSASDLIVDVFLRLGTLLGRLSESALVSCEHSEIDAVEELWRKYEVTTDLLCSTAFRGLNRRSKEFPEPEGKIAHTVALYKHANERVPLI